MGITKQITISNRRFRKVYVPLRVAGVTLGDGSPSGLP